MRVGINGMGRMGRLALRAAFGAIQRAEGDPRAENRLDVAHVNEIKGGAAATAHLLEFDSIHGRWRTSFEVDGDTAITVGGKRIGFSCRRRPGDVPWGDLGCDIVLECTGKFVKPEQLQAYFERGVQARHRCRTGQGRGRVQHRRRRQRPPLRPGAAQADHRGILHHQLPRAGRQGRSMRRSASATARSPPSTTRPTPTWSSTRRTRICAGPARPCSRCSPPPPAVPRPLRSSIPS